MKKYLIIAIAIMLASCSGKNTTEPSEVKNSLPIPVKFYKFDVKTKWSDKMSVSGAKNGLISQINSTSWGVVGEVNEDYSVWIQNCTRTKVGTQVTVTFDFELHTPAYWTDGDVLKTKRMSVTYDSKADWESVKTPNSQDVAALMKKYVSAFANSNLAKFGAAYLSAGQINIIMGLLNGLMKDDENANQKAEAALIGAETLIQLQIWILEEEK